MTLTSFFFLSFFQLAEQNQDLLSLKMTLHEKIKKQERVISSEKFQLNQRVAKELSECTKEMQNLVQVCLQSAEGSEPNVSMLLGIRCEYLELVSVMSSPCLSKI